MKTSIKATCLQVLCLASLHAQGPLAHPGAPAPTMKTLTEIFDQGTTTQQSVSALKNDPRTFITTAPFTITVSGSYVLGANLTVAAGDAITISASNVTLDLNGFTISSTHPSGLGTAVLMNSGVHGIRIYNGSIESGTTVTAGGVFSRAGFENGIYNAGAVGSDITVSNLHVRGVSQYGIYIGPSSDGGDMVDRCVVRICPAIGIYAHAVKGCSATQCGSIAISGTTVESSTGISVEPTLGGSGIVAKSVSNSSGTAYSGTGISPVMVINSDGQSYGTALGFGYGIYAITVGTSGGTAIGGIGIGGTTISNSYGTSSSGYGIYVSANIVNSFGSSISGDAGIKTDGTASYCQGYRNGGTAISAGIAVGCTVSGSGTVNSPQKHLGTP